MISKTNLTPELWFALINLGICSIIFYFSICKLNTKVSKRFIKSRVQSVILLGVSIGSGLQPLLWATIPNVGTLIATGGILLILILSKNRWWH